MISSSYRTQHCAVFYWLYGCGDCHSLSPSGFPFINQKLLRLFEQEAKCLSNSREKSTCLQLKSGCLVGSMPDSTDTIGLRLLFPGQQGTLCPSLLLVDYSTYRGGQSMAIDFGCLAGDYCSLVEIFFVANLQL